MKIENIHKNWRPFFEEEMAKPYYSSLVEKLDEEEKHHRVFPQKELRLRAFESTDPKNLKAVIMGQDCYFSTKSTIPQAVGLSFSVPKELEKLPPSLKNIYAELERNIENFERPNHGCLESWSDEVLLLNAVLSVRAGTAASHAKKMGWEILTRSALKYLSDINEGFVYFGWGKFAHTQSELVDKDKHLIIRTSHPSPLGNYKSGKGFVAFTGSECFLTANEWLEEKYGKGIDWRID